VAALAIVTLLPNIGSGMWRTGLHDPALFTTTAYRKVIAPGSTVLTLPFAQSGESMLWQAQTDFRFKMADGYLGALTPADFIRDLGTPRLWIPGQVPSPRGLRQFLADRRVRIVLVDATQAGPWPAALTAIGLHARSLGGVLVYRVP
jgi:hypothetical protein